MDHMNVDEHSDESSDSSTPDLSLFFRLPSPPPPPPSPSSPFPPSSAGRTTEFTVSPATAYSLANGFRLTRQTTRFSLNPALCVPAGYLDCEIHPLFRKEKFDDVSNELYAFLEPALRLATYFVESPACMKYWATLMFGERVLDARRTLLNERPAFRIRALREPSMEEIIGVRDVMLNMSQIPDSRYHFSSTQSEIRNDKHHWARCHSDVRFRNKLDRYKPLWDPSTFCFVITLSRDLYQVAETLRCGPRPSQTEVLRFNFFFAEVMCHELSHAIEKLSLLQHCYRHDLGNIIPAMPYDETYLLDNEVTEAGRMFESLFLGGEIQPRRHFDVSLPLTRRPWPEQSGRGALYRDLPDWFVNLVQLPIFWKVLESGRYPHFLNDDCTRIQSIGEALRAMEEAD